MGSTPSSFDSKNRYDLIAVRVTRRIVREANKSRLGGSLSEQDFSDPLPPEPGFPLSDSIPSTKRSFVADSLATRMLVMLVMTVVQRAVGFLRGIWFCRLLDDALLGQWSMAYDFAVMVTPIMLLGLPGSLPRYVEHYRARGHLRGLVRRLLIGTVVLGSIFFVLLLALPEWFGWLVFSEPTNASLAYSVGLCVVAVVAFSFVNQLVAALPKDLGASLPSIERIEEELRETPISA